MRRILTIILTAVLSSAAVIAQEVDTLTVVTVPAEPVLTADTIQPTEYLAPDPAPYYKQHPHSLQISAGLFSGFWVVKQMVEWIPAAAGHSRNWNFYGNYGLQYYYQFNHYCRLGGKINWELDAYDIYESKAEDAKKKGVTRNNTASLVASVQFTYLNRPRVQLYSGVDLGVAAHFANTKYEPGFTGEDGKATWLPAFNLSPLGVAFGSWPVYGYVETNIGYDAILKAGLGVHF